MNHCILVVDDSGPVRRVIAQALRDASYSVLEAEDGAEALEILKAAGDEIDLVLTDIRMPRMDGVELGRRIAEGNWQVPILFMSGDAGDLPAPVLRKPFSMSTLVKIVSQLLPYAAVDSAMASESSRVRY